ncbi:MAG: hypothetical protein JWR67_1972 [Mucilaginibacter sp.]|nr:hypothetical protein [Mucilaginibacter sp.]
MVAAAKTYDVKKLAAEVLKQRIKHGEQEYNPFVEGLFEVVNLPQEGKADSVFYIYSAMPQGKKLKCSHNEGIRYSA